MAADVQRHIARRRSPSQRALRVGFGILRVLLYILICVIFLTPFAWMFFGGLRAEREIFAYLTPLSWRTFIPIEWTLDSYQTILGLNEAGRRLNMNFGRNLLNSLIVSTAVVISSLFFNTMGAYFFARLPFWRMQPFADATGNVLGLADPGKVYVAYLPHGGTAKIVLADQNPLTARWFNPRTARFTEPTSVVPGNLLFESTAPDASDWVLLVERALP